VHAGDGEHPTREEAAVTENEEFNLTCVECGVAIRVSRTTNSDIGELAFYADEEGLENRDFHWHVA